MRKVVTATIQPLVGKVAEIDVVYRSTVEAKDRPVVISSAGAYILFIQNWDLDKIHLVEQFKVLFLDRSGKVLGLMHHSTGGITGTVADMRIVFAAAMRIRAVSLVLGHNHPSGNMTSSQEDRRLTRKFQNIGEVHDIKVLDHLIVGEKDYYSFADEGVM